MTLPKVTVLMSVYNGEKYLREAIDSILSQTFTDFEFLIVDDGSTDSSAEIIASYKDKRIRLSANPNNMGIIFSLNKGLDLAKGEYIARMDADDISLPTRLEKQVTFMELHPKVGVCGSWTMLFSGPGKLQRLVLRFPTTSEEIKSSLLFENVIQHPTVLMRRSILQKHHLHYPVKYPHVEDYALWLNLANVTDLAIIGEVLLHYRLHANRVGETYTAIQKVNDAKLHLEELANLGIRPSQQQLKIHEKISFGQTEVTKDSLDQTEKWLLKLREANKLKKVYSQAALDRVLGKKWLSVCVRAITMGPSAWQRFWQSPLSTQTSLSPGQKIGFWIGSVGSPFIKPILIRVNNHKVSKVVYKLISG